MYFSPSSLTWQSSRPGLTRWRCPPCRCSPWRGRSTWPGCACCLMKYFCTNGMKYFRYVFSPVQQTLRLSPQSLDHGLGVPSQAGGGLGSRHCWNQNIFILCEIFLVCFITCWLGLPLTRVLVDEGEALRARLGANTAPSHHSLPALQRWKYSYVKNISRLNAEIFVNHQSNQVSSLR